jgi:hypothetical protein
MERNIDLSYIYTTPTTSEGKKDYNANDEIEKINIGKCNIVQQSYLI